MWQRFVDAFFDDHRLIGLKLFLVLCCWILGGSIG